MALLVSALALAYFVVRHRRMAARSVGGGEPPA
jgi:hypothetical protein